MKLCRGFRNGNYIHFKEDDGGSGGESLEDKIDDVASGLAATLDSGKGAKKDDETPKPKSDPEPTAEAEYLIRRIVEGVAKALAPKDDEEDEAPKPRKRRAAPTPPEPKKSGIFGFDLFKRKA